MTNVRSLPPYGHTSHRFLPNHQIKPAPTPAAFTGTLLINAVFLLKDL